MKQEQLNEIIRLHGLWLESNPNGVRADMVGADMRGADMRGATMIRANLSGADMRGANMHDANMDGANLSGAYMRGANMVGADMVGANLSGATMVGAYMVGANMRRADMYGANMRRADMYGANMVGAYMRDAILSETRGLIYTSVSWVEHGEKGRTLLAIRINGIDQYFCGCFRGTLKDLRQYIKIGNPAHTISRTIAADFCEARMKEMK